MSGTVTGVGCRYFVSRLAGQHGLSGWVRNDGAVVRMHVQGDAQALENFLVALTEDPPEAMQIAGVEVSAVPLEDFTAFTIRRD
jgi:hydrogenase maturation protein HypF